MASVLFCLALGLVACDDGLVGLKDVPSPLATVRVKITGDIGRLPLAGKDEKGPNLRVGLLWGRQALPETFCTQALLPGDPSLTAVAEAGCRDPFGFVAHPDGIDVSVPATPGEVLEIPLLNLPRAELLVGQVSGRIGYATVVVYDDANGNGTLDLAAPPTVVFDLSQGFVQQGGGGMGGGDQIADSKKREDMVLGSTFVSMTRKDTRISFREGTFDELSAFYPRTGCPAPPKGFGIVGSSGFDLLDAFAAFAKGELPKVTDCTSQSLEDTVIELPVEVSAEVRQVGCRVGGTAASGQTRYVKPPPDDNGTKVVSHGPQSKPTLATPLLPDLSQPWVCRPTAGGSGLGGLGLPNPGAKPDGKPSEAKPKQMQLVLALPSTTCKGLVHYVLRGCQNDANCEKPQWDLTKAPGQVPKWWPCPLEAP